ncbi:MAG: GNAT family acetyltransferase [Rhodobacterales bacterium]|nr:GNAT family acetyltransferase [Rhodobacterales bacterium]
MPSDGVILRRFEEADEPAVIALWHACGLTRPWNDPVKDIRRKLDVQRDLFLVAERDGRVVGAAMAGYDGHRGWVYYLAVHPEARRTGLGRRLMDRVAADLKAMGCPKINLMIRGGNDAVAGFYDALGYGTDAVAVRALRLIPDD